MLAVNNTHAHIASNGCPLLTPSGVPHPALVSGAEWWVRVKGSDWHKPSVNLHFDADEEMKALSGEHLPPTALLSRLSDQSVLFRQCCFMRPKYVPMRCLRDGRRLIMVEANLDSRKSRASAMAQ